MDFRPPVLLGDAINSVSEDVSPLLSPDGKSLYFVRALHENNNGGATGGMDIWRSDKNDQGVWQAAINETRWNTKDNNAVIGISRDGKTVYLLNAYKNRDGVVFSKLFNGSWTAPQLIPIKGINKSNLVGFYMSPSFDVLLISKNDKDSFGQEDLYVSVRDSLDHWSEPQNLGPVINTPGFEISPFLSADGKKLYFSSNGSGGYGDADIFVSDRLYDSWLVWSKPRNLGPVINSEKFDAYFSMPNDSLGFFASNRNSSYSDLYEITVKQKSKSALRDSVNKIIKDTQDLLTGMKEDKRVETLRIDFVSPSSPSSFENQVRTALQKYDLKKIIRMEIIVYSNRNEDNVRRGISNASTYLIRSGVQREKITSRIDQQQQQAAFNVEIKLTLPK